MIVVRPERVLCVQDEREERMDVGLPAQAIGGAMAEVSGMGGCCGLAVVTRAAGAAPATDGPCFTGLPRDTAAPGVRCRYACVAAIPSSP